MINKIPPHCMWYSCGNTVRLQIAEAIKNQSTETPVKNFQYICTWNNQIIKCAAKTTQSEAVSARCSDHAWHWFTRSYSIMYAICRPFLRTCVSSSTNLILVTTKEQILHVPQWEHLLKLWGEKESNFRRSHIINSLSWSNKNQPVITESTI